MILTLLDLLNRYSNLILIIVTTVYVILTWGMVKEMQRAREAESESHLVAALIPFGVLYVKLRIYNTGPGPALNVKASISLVPPDGVDTSNWQHPALLSSTHEDFRLPSGEYSLEKLASKYDKLIVVLQWHNAFRRTQSAKYEFDFKQQEEGWVQSGLLVPPDDVPVQLSKIRDELSKIRGHLDALQRQRQMGELLEEYERERKPWQRLWQKVLGLFQKRQ